MKLDIPMAQWRKEQAERAAKDTTRPEGSFGDFDKLAAAMKEKDDFREKNPHVHPYGTDRESASPFRPNGETNFYFYWSLLSAEEKEAAVQRYQRSAANSALNTQQGGAHYKDLPIQPVSYIHANGIGFFEGNVIKYVSRWKSKGGIGDLEKAKHYLELLIELESKRPSLLGAPQCL